MPLSEDQIAHAARKLADRRGLTPAAAVAIVRTREAEWNEIAALIEPPAEPAPAVEPPAEAIPEAAAEPASEPASEPSAPAPTPAAKPKRTAKPKPAAS